MRLLLDKIRLALQKRTKVTQKHNNYDTWAAKGYNNTPEVSIIMQSHNKSLQIIHVVEKLRSVEGIEIIVVDDGSDLQHTRRLAEFLCRANEFMVRSNDLFENVTYDKTLRFANGKYIALLQDDDDFDSTEWIDTAVALLKKHDDMVILGGKGGFDVVFEDDRHYAHGGSTMQQKPFCFAIGVNRAPMWINKRLFEERLHHINFDFAPFQFDDYELCIRAWLEGLKVGWYDAGFKSLSVGGMRLWNNSFSASQSERNGRQMYALYKDRIGEARRRAKEANRSIGLDLQP